MGSCLTKRMTPSTTAMNASCPISTPTLKANSASGTSLWGSPISISALAKPSPCKRPKEKATAQGRLAVKPGSPRSYLAGNQEALSPAARAGLAKFINTGCVACHNGIGVGGAMYQKFGVVEDYWKATGSEPVDKGRADVTKKPA